MSSYILASASSQDPAPDECRTRAKRHCQLALLIFALNLISAILFIAFVNRPVYDDEYNIVDVHSYATNGATSAAIREQRNAPGPASYIWMATAVRVLRGGELRDARIGAALSWVLLAGGTFAFVRYGAYAQEWCGAMLVLFVFPHAVEASATVLTEGPALLFAILGALAWIEFSAREKTTTGSVALGIIGGLSMGIAVTSRQYFLALLPAAAILAGWKFRLGDHRCSSLWKTSAALSLALAALPIVVLVMLWKGATSPSMAAGATYANWQIKAGANFFRPVTALLYTAVYLLPLSFPVMLRLRRAWHWRAIPVAILAGLGAARFHSQLLQPGPLRSGFYGIARDPVVIAVLFGVIVAIAMFNAVALAQTLWQSKVALLSRPAVTFALLAVVIFIAEQVGVGGNAPFYDRYLLQIAPFLGLISFAAVPRLSYARLAVLAGMSILSHAILWRYAFGP